MAGGGGGGGRGGAGGGGGGGVLGQSGPGVEVLRCIAEAHGRMGRVVEQFQARSEQPRPVATAVVALTGAIGRPIFAIPHHQLEFLIESRFSVPQISHNILGVSISTVRRRMTN